MSNFKKKSEIRDHRIECRLFARELAKLDKLARAAAMSRANYTLSILLEHMKEMEDE